MGGSDLVLSKTHPGSCLKTAENHEDGVLVENRMGHLQIASQ